MGNYRFRLSGMIPNAWFYKLKDIGKTRKHYISHPTKKNPPPPNTTSQKPHFFEPTYSPAEPTRADRFSDTNFPEPPRKPSKRRAKRKTIYKPSPRLVSSSVSPDCSCHATKSPDYFVTPTDGSPEPDLQESISSESECYNFDVPESCSSSANCKVSSSTTDTIIHINNEFFTTEIEKFDGFDAISELELPPILTKPPKFKCNSSRLDDIKDHGSLSVKIVNEESVRTQKVQRNNPYLIRKSSTSSTGIKFRANSPRILGSRKMKACVRKSAPSSTCSNSRNISSISESFAIVKLSFDPQTDFMNSMVEMIVENNIRASKDLEELLVCYLSLNSSEYHDDIVKAFEQIWCGI